MSVALPTLFGKFPNTRLLGSKSGPLDDLGVALVPHELLLAIVRGEEIDGHKPTLAERLRAAVIAAPYYAPKLASVAHTGPDGGKIIVEIVKFGGKNDRPEPGNDPLHALERRNFKTGGGWSPADLMPWTLFVASLLWQYFFCMWVNRGSHLMAILLSISSLD